MESDSTEDVFSDKLDTNLSNDTSYLGLDRVTRPDDYEFNGIQDKEHNQSKPIKKSVSFGSTTEIGSSYVCGDEKDATEIKIKSEPGKLVLPSDLINICQVTNANQSTESTKKDGFQQHAGNGGSMQIPIPQQQCLIPTALPQMMPSVYPATGVGQPYNFQQDISKEEDGKDLPFKG